MKQLLTFSSGLLAIMLIIALGCSPEPSDSVSMDVPDGMEKVTFSVTGMR